MTYVFKFSFKHHGRKWEEYYADPADAEEARLLKMRALIWGNDYSEISEIEAVVVWSKETATA